MIISICWNSVCEELKGQMEECQHLAIAIWVDLMEPATCLRVKCFPFLPEELTLIPSYLLLLAKRVCLCFSLSLSLCVCVCVVLCCVCVG